MENSTAIAIFGAVMAVCFVILRLLEAKLGHRIGESEQAAAQERRVNKLQEEVNEQKRLREEESAKANQRIRELEDRVNFLLDQLQRSSARTMELERKAADLERAVTTVAGGPDRLREAAKPTKPLCIICGADTSFCNADRGALKRAGVSFQRISGATKKSIEAEFQRRRSDGTMYIWLHVSAHASENGVHFDEGVASPEWWCEVLTSDVRVVFLAACRTTTVADAIAGITTVVFVNEDIENKDASLFTYAFWRRMVEHGDPKRAYDQAVKEVPSVAEYTDIRQD